LLSSLVSFSKRPGLIEAEKLRIELKVERYLVNHTASRRKKFLNFFACRFNRKVILPAKSPPSDESSFILFEEQNRNLCFRQMVPSRFETLIMVIIKQCDKGRIYFKQSSKYIVSSQELIAFIREAYDAFFSRYPYCYGYWKKYSELEKRFGTAEQSEMVCRDPLLF
jgi:hypothetical protein